MAFPDAGGFDLKVLDEVFSLFEVDENHDVERMIGLQMEELFFGYMGMVLTGSCGDCLPVPDSHIVNRLGMKDYIKKQKSKELFHCIYPRYCLRVYCISSSRSRFLYIH